MAQQTGQNMLVAYKEESSFDTAPGDTGGTRVRFNPGQGLTYDRAIIRPGEVLSSQMTRMARLGSGSVAGGYTGDAYGDGSWDDWLEALVRSTWVAAVAITETEMTSITTTTNTIVAAGGSWITEGVRVGDVVRLTNHQTSENNDLNLRVTGVTATTITVAGSPLTTDASADTSFTLTILKKLTNASSPTRRSFYLEEYFQDIDQSMVYGGCKIVRLVIRGEPNGMATFEWGIVGASGDDLATGDSPYYTSPTLNSGTGLVFADAAVRFDGADLAGLTSFEMTIDIGGTAQAVLGNANAAGVFERAMTIEGSISVLREDLDNFAHLTDEDELELHVLLEEEETAPKDCIGIFVPRLKLTGADAPIGEEGAMIESLPFIAGEKPSETGYDNTMISIASSAA